MSGCKHNLGEETPQRKRTDTELLNTTKVIRPISWTDNLSDLFFRVVPTFVCMPAYTNGCFILKCTARKNEAYIYA